MKRIASLALILALALSLAAPVSAADKTTGTKMSLEEFDGTVTVRDAAGKDKTARADMRLYNGYTIATGKASSAYINLDDTAAVKLDRGTKVEIRTLGKQLDVHLLSGQLFFDTKVPRKADQSYTISTSTTVTGVRGSFGWVNLKQMGMVHGHSTVTYVDEETGKTVTIPITSGEGLSCNEDGGAAVSGNAGAFKKTVLTVEDIPAIVAEAIAADPQKQAQVDEVANLDTQEIVDSVDEKKEAEAQAEEKAEKTAEEAAEQQQEEIRQLDDADKKAGETNEVKLDADKKAEEEAKAREEAREERIREREEITEPPVQPSEPSQPSTPSVVTTYGFVYSPNGSTGGNWCCILADGKKVSVPDDVMPSAGFASGRNWARVTVQGSTMLSVEGMPANSDQSGADGLYQYATAIGYNTVVNSSTADYPFSSNTVFIIAQLGQTQSDLYAITSYTRKVGINNINVEMDSTAFGCNYYAVCDSAENVIYAVLFGEEIASSTVTITGVEVSQDGNSIGFAPRYSTTSSTVPYFRCTFLDSSGATLGSYVTSNNETGAVASSFDAMVSLASKGLSSVSIQAYEPNNPNQVLSEAKTFHLTMTKRTSGATYPLNPTPTVQLESDQSKIGFNFMDQASSQLMVASGTFILVTATDSTGATVITSGGYPTTDSPNFALNFDPAPAQGTLSYTFNGCWSNITQTSDGISIVYETYSGEDTITVN